jgi:hypothetical protein
MLLSFFPCKDQSGTVIVDQKLKRMFTWWHVMSVAFCGVVFIGFATIGRWWRRGRITRGFQEGSEIPGKPNEQSANACQVKSSALRILCPVN